MGKVVWRVFKIIIVFILLSIAFDVSTYLSRVWALNENVKGLQTTLSSEVSKNNYLTEDAYNMYMSLLQDMKNRDSGLIVSYKINYGNSGVTNSEGTSPNDDLSEPKNYGEARKIQIVVQTRRLIWGSVNSDGHVGEMNDLQRGWQYGTYYYEDTVPCLRLVK